MASLQRDLDAVAQRAPRLRGPNLAPKAVALAWLHARGPAEAREVADAVGRGALPLHAAIYAVSPAGIARGRAWLRAYRRACTDARDGAVATILAETRTQAYEAWPTWLQLLWGEAPSTPYQRARRLQAKCWLPWDGPGTYDPALSVPWRPTGAAAWAMASPEAYDRTVRLINAHRQKFVDSRGQPREPYRIARDPGGPEPLGGFTSAVHPGPSGPWPGPVQRAPGHPLPAPDDPVARAAARHPLDYTESFLPRWAASPAAREARGSVGADARTGRPGAPQSPQSLQGAEAAAPTGPRPAEGPSGSLGRVTPPTSPRPSGPEGSEGTDSGGKGPASAA